MTEEGKNDFGIVCPLAFSFPSFIYGVCCLPIFLTSLFSSLHDLSNIVCFLLCLLVFGFEFYIFV